MSQTSNDFLRVLDDILFLLLVLGNLLALPIWWWLFGMPLVRLWRWVFKRDKTSSTQPATGVAVELHNAPATQAHRDRPGSPTAKAHQAGRSRRARRLLIP